MFALYAGASGGPATADDCEWYAEYIGNPNFPVFADAGGSTIAAATPMTATTHPELCVIGPDMSLIACFSGHNKLDAGFSAIREHVGSK